jgi:hypothetical protein
MPRILNKRSRLGNALRVNYLRLIARKGRLSLAEGEGESEGRSTRLTVQFQPLTSVLSPRARGEAEYANQPKDEQSSLSLFLPLPPNSGRLAHEVRVPDYLRRIFRR